MQTAPLAAKEFSIGIIALGPWNFYLPCDFRVKLKCETVGCCGYPPPTAELNRNSRRTAFG